MPRRVRLTVLLSVISMLILVTGISAGADSRREIQSTRADIAEAQDRLMEIRVKESTAAAAFSHSISEMNRLNVEINDASDDLDAAQKNLAVAQKDLEDRASQVYK